ncbi:MAG: 23S rRNA pseudouridine(1911/1915/1917) synthase RluD [Halomonas sp.]|nr:23S rRNA pseudouridine(1911/1915/1917) synthase RluD [Halomonas sp.]MDN6297666.1 23S rRNA pseudouridine(1911/1915/1917) synthase RluD [Halomonas sp.]MDN6315004.1 23S rRNA pseudouridine(1911/1915/1917) synthase RluD [Halomonas sp.]MDN6336346.1 23S rRNA pseudouridine(1911/1915/1917) synthase RluD [Halomonas sp.]
MTRTVEATMRVPAMLAGARLDQAAAELFSDYSRERLKAWINRGELTVDGERGKPKTRLIGDETLALCATLEEEQRFTAQDIALDIVFEDEHVLIVNKPAGMVVHPAAGNPDGTLLNALLHHDPALADIPRAGIVHRLDKDTTGLLMVARTLPAQAALVEQLQARTVSRQYDAVVIGTPVAGGTVDAPIGRHPKDRKRQAVNAGGKPAVTHYRVVERFRTHTHVRCKLETGRTHQIRVHMAHARYPLIGDQLYGGRPKLPPGAADTLKEILREFPRQALHARRLGFVHPHSGQEMTFRAPLPDDLLMLLDYLREDHETMR